MSPHANVYTIINNNNSDIGIPQISTTAYEPTVAVFTLLQSSSVDDRRFVNALLVCYLLLLLSLVHR